MNECVQSLLRIFFLLFFIQSCSSQKKLEELKGRWISSNNEMLIINDFEKSQNFLLNKEFEENNYYIEILKDTISFQHRYYTSDDNFEKLFADKYNLKILKFSDSVLKVIPVSNLSQDFFSTKKPINFYKNGINLNGTIDFQKITFTTSTCYGNCPELKMNIFSDGRVELNAVYFDDSVYTINKRKSGNFTANLGKQKLLRLKYNLKLSRVNQFELIPEDSMSLCCDGALKEMIIEFNDGKKHKYITMFEPVIIFPLIDFLYDLPNQLILKRSKEQFEFEKLNLEIPLIKQ